VPDSGIKPTSSSVAQEMKTALQEASLDDPPPPGFSTPVAEVESVAPTPVSESPASQAGYAAAAAIMAAGGSVLEAALAAGKASAAASLADAGFGPDTEADEGDEVQYSVRFPDGVTLDGLSVGDLKDPEDPANADVMEAAGAGTGADESNGSVAGVDGGGADGGEAVASIDEGDDFIATVKANFGGSFEDGNEYPVLRDFITENVPTLEGEIVFAPAAPAATEGFGDFRLKSDRAIDPDVGAASEEIPVDANSANANDATAMANVQETTSAGADHIPEECRGNKVDMDQLDQLNAKGAAPAEADFAEVMQNVSKECAVALAKADPANFKISGEIDTVWEKNLQAAAIAKKESNDARSKLLGDIVAIFKEHVHSHPGEHEAPPTQEVRTDVAVGLHSVPKGPWVAPSIEVTEIKPAASPAELLQEKKVEAEEEKAFASETEKKEEQAAQVAKEAAIKEGKSEAEAEKEAEAAAEAVEAEAVKERVEEKNEKVVEEATEGSAAGKEKKSDAGKKSHGQEERARNALAAGRGQEGLRGGGRGGRGSRGGGGKEVGREQRPGDQCLRRLHESRWGRYGGARRLLGLCGREDTGARGRGGCRGILKMHA